MRVLYVEDDARDADLAQRALAREAPEIELVIEPTLAGGRARIAAAEPFDLLLTDLRLPDGSGLEALTQVRERGLPIAVVILTGTGDETTAIAALRAGADDYVMKGGAYLERLGSTLKAALTRSREEAARRARPLTVLYAEHHAADIDVTRRHLARQAPQIRLEVVHRADEVLRRLPFAPEPAAYDVILLDHRLPGMNAIDLLKVIREDRALDVPVVLVTGQGDEDTAAQALRLGANDYVIKTPGYVVALPAVLDRAAHAARLALEHAALAESEARYRDVVESSQEMICTHDLEGRLLSVNEASARISGFDREHLLTIRLTEVLAPEAAAQFAAGVRDLREHGSARGILKIVTASGEIRYLEYHSILREGPRGPIAHAIARDVTERHEAEQVLRRAEERLRRAVSAGNVGLWDWDLLTREIYFSPEWKRQLGYDPEELEDAFETWHARLHPDDVRRVDEALSNFMARPEDSFEVEFRLRHHDGSYRNILSQAAAELNSSGNVVRMLGSHIDITQRTEIEAQFRQAQKMESIGRLAGGIAHDFNNLLTVIVNFAELVHRGVHHDPKLQNAVQQIQRAALRASDLTRQLLTFSRREVARPESLSVNRIVGEVGRMLPRLIGKHIVVRIDLAPEAGMVTMDPGQLEQILMNLAVNANDAMPAEGTLSIRTRPAPTPAEDSGSSTPVGLNMVEIEVSDTGIGMDDTVRAHIFEPFFTTKPVGKGTGLGLSTVYGIVKAAGGTIHVESTPGKGTTFRVLLPRTVHAAELADPGSPEFARGRGETILVVENEEVLGELTQTLLETAGYRVVLAAGVDEALALARRTHVDLLLTDVVMPNGGGRILAERFSGLFPSAPVLFMSGYTEDTVLEQGIATHAVNFIRKPFTWATLARKVRDVLDGAGEPHESPAGRTR